MFPSYAVPTSLPLSHDQTANQNSSSSFHYPPLTNNDQTNKYYFEDILDNYQSVIDQPSYQDSTPLDLSHLSRSNEQTPVLQEMTTAETRYDQDYSCLGFAASLTTNEQNLHFQETITSGPCSESTDNSIDISLMPRPNNFHMDEVMRESLHAGLKLALRMRTNLEVIDDGYKWRKYGKKKVKSSPYPRNYFKCSSEGCSVKKRIERDRDDSNYVITTYDGVHHHEVPPNIQQ